MELVNEPPRWGEVAAIGISPGNLRPSFEYASFCQAFAETLEKRFVPFRKTLMIRNYFEMAVRFLKEEDGPTAVEYAVVLSLILGTCIAAVGALSVSVGESFDASGNALAAAFGN